MWYVIQTTTGKETIVKSTIDNMVPRELFEECRIILYEAERKYGGAWHKEQRTLFPGYLFVITDHVEHLYKELKKIPQMTKLLGTGRDIVPVSKEEEHFLRRLCGDDNHVEMSRGVQVGDEIIVREGSLKGLESCIRKIDRHKRKAYIELPFLGETRLVEVGLEVVEKH